jgi:hypothetical protein
VALGQGNRIQANVYAPFGSFTTGEGCMLEGSFIAKDITIGQKTVVKYNGAFITEEPGPGPVEEIILTATSYKYVAEQYVVLNWTGATSETVDIYRDDEVLPDGDSVVNTGEYTDPLGKKPPSYTYKVCEDCEGTECPCSNEVTVEF